MSQQVSAGAFGRIPHLSVASSLQNSLRRESSAPAPGDALLPSLGAAPTLERRVATLHLPTGEDTISEPPTHTFPRNMSCGIHLTFYNQKVSLASRSIGNLLPPSVCKGEQPLSTITLSYQLLKVLNVSPQVSGREGSEQRVPLVALGSSNKEAAAEVRRYRVSVQAGAHQLPDRLRWERGLHSHSWGRSSTSG